MEGNESESRGEIEGEREVKEEARGEKKGIWRSNPPMEM